MFRPDLEPKIFIVRAYEHMHISRTPIVNWTSKQKHF